MAAHVLVLVVWRYRVPYWDPVLLLYGVFGAGVHFRGHGIVERPGAAGRSGLPAGPPVEARWLGRIGYPEALSLQEKAAARIARGGPETFFLLEHDPVFTLGRNASAADVLFTPERRRELGIGLVETDRGGKVTYHGPGQLVGYPVLNLDPDRRDVRRYVRDLERS